MSIKSKYVTCEVQTALGNRAIKRARRVRLIDAEGYVIAELDLEQAPHVAEAQPPKAKAKKKARKSR